MFVDNLVLAGGGHTHALILMRWAKNPHLRPHGVITLVNRDSTAIYSGMFPGLLSRKYKLDEVSIDLRQLCIHAGVSLIIDEIVSLELSENRLVLKNRPSLGFSRLSLDVGSETSFDNQKYQIHHNNNLVLTVKPFKQAFQAIKSFDSKSIIDDFAPFIVIGSGLAAIEIAFALRKRWPKRKLILQAFKQKLHPTFRKFLSSSNIEIIDPKKLIHGDVLICTGGKAPDWIKSSGLTVSKRGRIFTKSTFQVYGRPNVFAVGDCGLIKGESRPPSGVWAVRAAIPLARNIERDALNQKLLKWRPQKFGLRIVGGFSKTTTPIAWLDWGSVLIGPNNLFWNFKESIDRNFMNGFKATFKMLESKKKNSCRGCAAKVSLQPLKAALKLANLSELANNPEDSVRISSSLNSENWFQSVDGFPALVDDPWLNARLTTLHACSDLWASGADVKSAQAVIGIPEVHPNLQKELLNQCLSGIQSALLPQRAKLIGGHTFESRAESHENLCLGIEISLAVNGSIRPENSFWTKGGLQPEDEILISRGIGSGVIFAAAMQGGVAPQDIDNALKEMSQSQHFLLKSIREESLKKSNINLVNACTDVTGFGLLGHLSEMIVATNTDRLKSSLTPVKVKLFANLIPSLNGAKDLIKAGYASTLAPANRRFWDLLSINSNSSSSPIDLVLGDSLLEYEEISLIKELIIDPQTCGPLIISCNSNNANLLIKNYSWQKIGSVCLV